MVENTSNCGSLLLVHSKSWPDFQKGVEKTHLRSFDYQIDCDRSDLSNYFCRNVQKKNWPFLSYCQLVSVTYSRL